MVYVFQSGYFRVISVVSSLCCACRHLPQSVYCSETAWQPSVQLRHSHAHAFKARFCCRDF